VIQTGLSDYLFDAIEREASDLHMTVGLGRVVGCEVLVLLLGGGI